MPFIRPLPDAEAYEADLADDGYVSNVSRAFSHRPDALAAWIGLKDAERARWTVGATSS